MAESHNLGKKGEDIAVRYLSENGFNIVTKNWTWGGHEVDIIAEKGDEWFLQK